MSEHPGLNADISEWRVWVDENYPLDTECRNLDLRCCRTKGLEKLRYVSDRGHAAFLANLYWKSIEWADEIAAEKAAVLRAKTLERRQFRIALVRACLDRKHGDEIQALAQRLVGFDPDAVSNDVLWDFDRHYRWVKARARGERVPTHLRSLHEIIRDRQVTKDRDDLYDALDDAEGWS